MFNWLKPAACIAAFVFVAPAMAATSVHISSVGIYTPGTVDISGPSLSGRYFSTVVKLRADTGGASFDLLGFCVDLFHPVSAGLNSQNPVNLNYLRAPFATDNNGTALSTAQMRQIGGLADIGFGIARGNDPEKAVRLAALQQAIWTIEYPTLNFVAGDTLAGQQAFANSYLALAPSLSKSARVIYADDNRTQGFIISGVPEPTTWALLIVGFGMVGVAARSGRGLTHVAA